MADFKKDIERQMLIWFGDKLDDDIEFDGKAWAIIDRYIAYTLGAKFDERLKKAEVSAQVWWKDKGGHVYARKAAREFARQINKKGNKPKDTDIEDAYMKAKENMEKLILAVMAKGAGALEVFSPILCEGFGFAKKPVTKKKK